jgi:hypothetical protein
MTLGAFDAYVQDQQEQLAIQQWNEYRAHGGKLDFTGWCEEQERKNEQ